MVTDELRMQIHQAMEQTGGKVPEAAVILGIPSKELHNIIGSNDDLKSRWCKAKAPPSEAVVIHRPAIPPSGGKLALRDEDEVTAAMERENRAVRKGLTAMGVSGSAAETALSLAKFQRAHFTSAIEMLGGGITKTFLEAMAEVENITRQLNSGEPMEPQRELMLREDRRGLLEAMQKFYDRANQNILTNAKVKSLQNSGNGPGKQAKPGFSPLVAVKVEGNATIAQGS